jgi:hypothetical protein
MWGLERLLVKNAERAAQRVGAYIPANPGEDPREHGRLLNDADGLVSPLEIEFSSV